MPITIKPLPPDDPIFHGGVSFVFRSELPPEPEHEHDVVDQDDDPDAPAAV